MTSFEENLIRLTSLKRKLPMKLLRITQIRIHIHKEPPHKLGFILKGNHHINEDN